MKFKPLTEDEIEKMLLLSDGIYNFEVIEASHSPAKSTGIDQIKLKLKVDNGENAPRFVYDFLNPGMMRKLIHFAKSTGLLEKYEKGELFATDCMHQRGQVEIIIKEKQQKQDGTFYPAHNQVKDYIIGFIPSNVIKDDKLLPEDDIPF